MSSSFMCPNCGIKVSVSEEAGCPGCGHKQSESLEVQESPVQEGAKFSFNNNESSNPFAKDEANDLEWVQNFLSTNADANEAEFASNPKGFLHRMNQMCEEALTQAPNEESRIIIYSYLSWVNLSMGRHEKSFEHGAKGSQSSVKFFRDQAYDSIFSSLGELRLNAEFEFWLEKARKIDYPELVFQEMQYFINTGQLNEALAKCDERFRDNLDWGTYNKAQIYQDFNKLEEAEILYRKLTSKRATDPAYPASANSLAWSILMPQGRYLEAESVLIPALCTTNIREKVNAYSNLAMVAFHLKEYDAATRYATVGAESHERAIASESRLTLLKIESQRLRESGSANLAGWDSLLELVLENIKNTDFDDAGEFFAYLITIVEKSSKKSEMAAIIEGQYQFLKTNIEWEQNSKVSGEIEKIRVEVLSEILLTDQKYPELEELFISAIDYLKNHSNPTLIKYLQMPVADLSFRQKCLAITEDDFLSEWALIETHPQILLGITANKKESILLAVAANPATPIEALQVIMEEKDLDLDFAISIRDLLPIELVKTLMTSPFDAVRREIAQRSDLVYQDYEILATDSSLLVRDAIKDNPACPPEIKALAALGSL